MNAATVCPNSARTLAELIDLRASDTPDRCAFSFLDGEAKLDISYGDLERHARSFALELHAQAEPGDRVLLLYPPGPAYVIAFFGCALAGVVPVPLYPPPPQRSRWRLQAIVKDAGARLALTDRALLNRFEATDEPLGPDVRVCVLDAFGTTSGSLPERARPDDVALLQYTSGSTGTPKGVIVSHHNILANTELIREAFALTAADVSVSWLPPYHDMGLIGSTITPVAVGLRAVVLTPLAFLRRPLRWLKTISDVGATISGAPNFAYALCARKAAPERTADLDLATWRIAFTGAEPVRATTLAEFSSAFAPAGFHASSFRPCYGLAEATLMVSALPSAAVPRTLTLDSAALAAGVAVSTAAQPAQTIVSCGRPPTGVSVVIADAQTFARLPDGTVGEIWVSSPGNARGYWGRPADDPTFSARLADGVGPYLRTGDLGFVLERDLFVTGRRKEVIIVNGRNLYPRDIEEVSCNAHPALDVDGSAAFPVTIGEQETVVFAAELRSTDKALRRAAAAAVREAVLRELEVALYDIRFVQPGALARTSSGKVRRLAMRDAYLAGSLDPR